MSNYIITQQQPVINTRKKIPQSNVTVPGVSLGVVALACYEHWEAEAGR